MKTQMLFDVPQTHPSRRDRIKEFKAAHQIETSCCRDDEMPQPWMAVHLPSARQLGYGVNETSSAFDCILKVGRLMDEAGISDYGETEREAILAVCRNVGIACEL